MIECETVIYQPGTGTRHMLIYGIIKDQEDARRLCCNVESIFLVWENVGAYEFSAGTVPGYLAEKFKIKGYMLDAIALTQFVTAKLGVPLMTGLHVSDTEWKICERCTLPFIINNEESECMCKKYGQG